MRSRLLAAAFSACVAVCLTATAWADTARRIGDWLVTTSPDHFAKHMKGFPTPNNIYALTIQKGQTFGVRCIGSRLSLAFIDADADKFTKGEDVTVLIRADAGEVIRTHADATSASMIDIRAPLGAVPAMMQAKRVSLRIITPSIAFDRSFTTRGAKAAVAALDEECVIE